MHDERTLRNLQASLEALREIIDAQRAYIQAVEHERDLFAEGYWAAIKKSDETNAGAYNQAGQNQLEQED